jgi:hypothetical protein
MPVENLSGGNSNQVQRRGDTVTRQTGPWSPFVQSVLRHLAAKGFTAVPQIIATTATTETLTFLPGTVGHPPLGPALRSDAVLMQAARLLRQLHDATQDFVVPAGARFLLPQEPDLIPEVICHNDFAPYNCVFADGRLVGVIDFDTAAPGPRLWDVAYAVYRFAPLMPDAHCVDEGWPTPPDRAARLRLFCEAYGLADRAGVIAMVQRRITALMAYMRAHDFNVDHLPRYAADLAYISAQAAAFNAVLC